MTMIAEDTGTVRTRSVGWRTRLARLAAKPGFQRWAARLPIARGIARNEGEALFDLVQGFVQSQMLYALVELRLLHRLMDGPLTVPELAQGTGVPLERMTRLLQAAAAMGLMWRDRQGRYGISRKGAAMIGVPGLEQLIQHHDVLYRDLADPLAFLRGETDPELARFWPYVFGAAGAVDPTVTSTYSDLMAQSQGLVAQDTLDAVSLRGINHLVDVGGGTGAFAEAAAKATADMRVTLFDLPAVMDAARNRLANSPVRDRLTLLPGSFRDDPLPDGADAISLIRVLYDHRDETIRGLLRKTYDGLPSGGRLVISEPMSGGARPESAGDVYFSIYCMAMGTGTVRSQARIAELCREAGFSDLRMPSAARPFVTSVVTARRI